MDQRKALHPQGMANDPRRHDAVSMSLHWLSLLLLILLFGAIWGREQTSDGDTALLFLTLHRSAGALIWVTTLARILWKVACARTPALPRTMPRLQRWAARVNEYALYLLLLVQPVTGFAQSIARGAAFPMLGLSVPALMARDKELAHLFHDVHETSAEILLLLVGLHACAALFHGIVLRDGVLRSMLPPRPRAFRK